MFCRPRELNNSSWCMAMFVLQIDPYISNQEVAEKVLKCCHGQLASIRLCQVGSHESAEVLKILPNVAWADRAIRWS